MAEKSRGSASLLNNLWTLWTLWTNVPSVYFFRKVSMFFRKKIMKWFSNLHISQIFCNFACDKRIMPKITTKKINRWCQLMSKFDVKWHQKEKDASIIYLLRSSSKSSMRCLNTLWLTLQEYKELKKRLSSPYEQKSRLQS